MNPAARLLATHNALKLISDEKLSMGKVWAQVFKLDDKHHENDVYVCLLALRSQIDLARARLTAIGVPEQLLRYGFQRLNETASPTQLPHGWNSLRAKLVAPECGAEFAWAAWALRDEDEEEMPAEEMQALNAELAELEGSLAGAEISAYLREFITHQIDAIRAALRVYPIRGAKPLQDALKQVAGSYTIEKGRLEKEQASAPAEAKGLLAKTVGIVEKTAKVCDNLDKIKKFGEGAWGIAQSVSAVVLPYAAKQIGGG